MKKAATDGLKDKPPFANPHPWANDCLFWLKEQGFADGQK